MAAILIPLRGVWTRPRRVLREALEEPHLVSAFLPSMGAGVVQSFLQGASNNMGAGSSTLGILVAAVPVGALWGLFQLHLFAGCLSLTARSHDGRVSFARLRTVVGVASMPLASALVPWLLAVAVLGRDLFVAPELVISTLPPGLAVQVGLLYIASAACWVWSLLVLVLGLREVEGRSMLHAVGSLAVAMLLALGVVLATVVATVAVLRA